MTLNPSQCMGPQSVGQKEESHGPQVKAIFRAMFEDAPPSVDVIIPVKGRVPFFLETLPTVLSQSHRPLHLIVVNDGCTSDEQETIERALDQAQLESECGGDAEKFTCECVPHAGTGAAAARNAGFRHGNSPYVLWMDSDDWLLPDKVAYDLGRLHGTGRDFVVSRAQHRQGDQLIDAFWGDSPSQNRPAFEFPFQTMCALFKRSFIIESSLHWNERMAMTNDWEFSNRALLKSDNFSFSDRVTAVYRRPNMESKSIGSVLTREKIDGQLLGIDKVLKLKKAAFGRIGWVYTAKHLRHAGFLLVEAIKRGHLRTSMRAVRSIVGVLLA